MKQTWHILIVSLASLLLLFPFNSASAAESSIFTRILHDFSPVTGRVLSVKGTEITVDCGKESSVVRGDLFQVYRKGSPVSRGGGGTIIGYLKQPFAILQAEKIYSSSSLCVRIGPDSRTIRTGMPVMRYSDMKAVLVMSPDMKVSNGVRQRFQDTLPALEWIDQASLTSSVDSAESMSAAGISLVFYMSRQKLTVYGPGYIPIHEYSLAGESSLEAPPTSPSGSTAPPSPGDRSASSGSRWNVDFSKAADLTAGREAGRLYSSARQVEVVDIDGDGAPETVYLVARALYLFPFGSQGRLFSWAVNGPGDAVGFFVSPGRGWIVVNVLVKGVGLRSVLLRYSGSSLVIIEDEINLWLSFPDMNGHGAHDTMLGQAFSLHKVWGDDVYRLSATDRGIVYLDKMSLPEDFRTGWTAWGDVDGNGQEDICLVDRSGRIYLFEEGILRWSSPAGVVRWDDKANTTFHAASVDLFGNGRRVIVFAGAVPSGGTAEPYRQGWTALYFIQWTGERFVMKPLTKPVKAMISGISSVENTLLVATVKRDEEDDDSPVETVLYRLDLPIR